MPLDTRLPLMAGAQAPIQFQPESQLQTLSRIAPAVNAMRQVQQQRVEAEQMQQRSAALDQLRQAAKGQDLNLFADALIGSGNNNLMQEGAKLKRALLEEAQFKRQYGGLTGNLTAEGMAALAGAGTRGVGIAKELGQYVLKQPERYTQVGPNVLDRFTGQIIQPPPREAPANALVPGAAPVAGGMNVDQRARYLNQRGFEEVDGRVRPIPGGPADPDVIRRQSEARRPLPPGPEGTPAQQQRAQSRSEAQQQLSQELQTVLGYYNELSKMGAMTSPERSTAENVIAAARATGPGQAAERFAGTRAQTLRDNIANARLRILNHVKNATGATASQMNSNVEFQTWLNALTSPGQSIETVRETLKQLDAVLGSVRAQVQREAQGAAPASAPAPAPAARAGAAAPAPARTGGIRREIAPGVFVTERP